MYPIQLAFAYWMRCSELSADRAAAICDGNTDKVIETCMRFAGYDKDIMDEASVDLFIEQALEYREFAKDSAWNKTLEFLQFQMYDHPQNAVRALEIKEWGHSERFEVIQKYFKAEGEEGDKILPIYISSKEYIGKDVENVYQELIKKGFTNISKNRITESNGKPKNETVVDILVDFNEFSEDWVKRDAIILLTYYKQKTDEEIAQEHAGKIMLSSKKFYVGRPTNTVKNELENLGFSDIEIKEMALSVFGKASKEDTVAKILIDEKDLVSEETWHAPDEKVIIYNYVKV